MWLVARARAAYVGHLAARPKVALSVVRGDPDDTRALLLGRAEVVAGPGRLEGEMEAMARRMARRYEGPDGDRYIDESLEWPRVLVRVVPDRIQSWGDPGWHPKYRGRTPAEGRAARRQSSWTVRRAQGPSSRSSRPASWRARSGPGRPRRSASRAAANAPRIVATVRSGRRLRIRASRRSPRWRSAVRRTPSPGDAEALADGERRRRARRRPRRRRTAGGRPPPRRRSRRRPSRRCRAGSANAMCTGPSRSAAGVATTGPAGSARHGWSVRLIVPVARRIVSASSWAPSGCRVAAGPVDELVLHDVVGQDRGATGGDPAVGRERGQWPLAVAALHRECPVHDRELALGVGDRRGRGERDVEPEAVVDGRVRPVERDPGERLAGAQLDPHRDRRPRRSRASATSPRARWSGSPDRPTGMSYVRWTTSAPRSGPVSAISTRTSRGDSTSVSVAGGA